MARRKSGEKAPPLDLVIDKIREIPEDGEPIVALFGRNPRIFEQMQKWEAAGAIGRLDGVKIVRAKRLPAICAKLDELGFTYEVNE